MENTLEIPSEHPWGRGGYSGHLPGASPSLCTDPWLQGRINPGANGPVLL